MLSTQEWTKNDLKHLLKHLFRGGPLICQKCTSQTRKNFEKIAKFNNQI